MSFTETLTRKQKSRQERPALATDPTFKADAECSDDLDTLLDVRDLVVTFPVKVRSFLKQRHALVHAVDGVSFTIGYGQTLGLVGESGSGKTTIGRAILRAIDPSAGQVLFHPRERLTKKSTGRDRAGSQTTASIPLHSLDKQSLRALRPRMSLVFQDPYSSLNPRMTVRDIIAEPLVCGGSLSRRQIDERVREIAARCKLNLEHLRRFPHAFSGGQRQRICIARALITKPDFVVCDESVSALDVSIQAEVINLLVDLQKELGVALLFIAHDLSVVAQISDHVAVLYVGTLVEKAPVKSLFSQPRHPYTKALLSAIPRLDSARSFKPQRLEGDIPDPMSLLPGCRFHTRCPHVDVRCRNEMPLLRELAPGHQVACHFAEQLE